MFIFFWFSLLLLAYPYFIYPILVFLFSKLFNETVDKKEIYPTVCLLISAYNEEKVIREKLENSLSLNYPKEKIEIVVASESNDATNKIVEDYYDKGVRLYAYSDRKGKPSTIYRTLPLVESDIIVFSDANAIYDKDAIKNLVRNFNDNRIGCVCGKLQYMVSSKNSSIGKGESTYWNYEIALKLMLSKMLCLGGGVNGSIFAIRKSLYSPINEFRGDDFELSNRIEIKGYGVVLEPDAVSYEMASETSKQEFTRKVRLASWNFKSASILLREALLYKRWITAWIIFSHRLSRYLSPFWLILLFVSNIVLFQSNLFYSTLLLLQLIFYSLSTIGYLKDRQGSKLKPQFLFPFYFCMANYAALLGTIKLFLNKDRVLWEKTR